jgi:signal transduction histidine kinase
MNIKTSSSKQNFADRIHAFYMFYFVLIVLMISGSIYFIKTADSYSTVDSFNSFVQFGCIFLILSLVLLFSTLYLYLENKKRVRSIKKIIDIGKNLTEGNLDFELDSRTTKEVKDLAQIIYDLGNNFQEVLLLVGSYSNDMREGITSIQESLAKINQKECISIKKAADRVLGEIDSLQNIVEDFNYYKVVYNHNKIIGKD